MPGPALYPRHWEILETGMPCRPSIVSPPLGDLGDRYARPSSVSPPLGYLGDRSDSDSGSGAERLVADQKKIGSSTLDINLRPKNVLTKL